MKIHCAILGFQIDRETVCGASGNHPLCRKCLGQENERIDSPAKKEKAFSDEVLRTVKKLIADECANFQRFGPMGIKNHCWMKEKSNAGICVYFNLDNPKCDYFEETVLPLDTDLKEDYFHGKEETNGRKDEDGSAIQRKGPGRSPGGLKVVTSQPQKPRMSVGESLREGLLSRAALHGVDSGKSVKNR